MNGDITDLIREWLEAESAKVRQNLSGPGAATLNGQTMSSDELTKFVKEVTQNFRTLSSAMKEAEKAMGKGKGKTPVTEAEKEAKLDAEADKKNRIWARKNWAKTQDALAKDEERFGLEQIKKRKRLEKIEQEKEKLAEDAKKKAARGEGVTMGRLPLASIPAMLRGNTSAGARVGYALGEGTGPGKWAGLGMGAGVAGAIGAGFAASPTGADVVMKPLQILAGTIGSMILPSLVKFGAALLDIADWWSGKRKDIGEAGQRAAGAGAGALIGGTLGALSPMPGGMAIGTVLGGMLGDQMVVGSQKKKQAALEAGAAAGDPDAVRELTGQKEGRLKSLQNQKMILQDMMQSMGGAPKMGTDLGALAKETQMAAFESPLEVRQKRTFQEGLDKVIAEIHRVEKSIRGQ